MSPEEHFEELLVRLEKLAESQPGTPIEDLIDDDEDLASEIRNDPDLLARLQAELQSLRQADWLLGLHSDAEPTPVISGFCDLHEIARGGMGIVYRAHQPSLKRDVAIKLMLAGGFGGKSLRTRFRKEMEAAARLNHPNIVEVYEVGETKGIAYGCFEYLAGKSLAESIAGRPMGERQAAEIAVTLARAVAFAHKQDVIHRDLKPSNIRSTKSGVVKITDFGLAKDLQNPSDLTQTGETPGSPSYMAPEQVRGVGVGPAVDVYALGAILYEMLTGRPPFLGGSSAETLVQVSTEDPLAPRTFRQSLSADLEAVCLKCLEKNPDRRYASASNLAEDLQRWLDGRVTLARPAGSATKLWRFIKRRPVVATIATVSCAAILALGGFGWWHGMVMQKSYEREIALRAEVTNNRDMAFAHEREALASARIAKSEKLRSDELLFCAKVWRAHEAWKSDQLHSFHSICEEITELETPSLRQTFPHRYLGHLANRDEITLQNGSSPVFAARFLDDETVVTGDEAGVIKSWDRTSGERLKEITAHSSCVNSLNVSHDGQFLASGSCDQTIAIWDLSDWSLRQKLISSSGKVGTVEFERSDQSLHSYSLDHVATRWNLVGESVAEAMLNKHSHLLNAVVNERGDWIVANYRFGEVHWWPLSDPTATRSHFFPTTLLAVAFNRTGDHIAAVGANGQIWLWDTEGVAKGSIFIDSAPGHTLVFSHDDKTFAVAGDDLVIRQFDVAKRRLLRKFKGHKTRVNDLDFSPNDGHLIAGLGSGKAKVWSIDEAADFHRVWLGPNDVRRAAISPSADWLAIGNRDGSIYLHHLESAGIVKKIADSDGGYIEGITFDAGGNLLTANGPEHERWSRTWDLSSGEAVLCTEEPKRITFDVSNSVLLRAVSGASESELLIESVESRIEPRTFRAPAEITVCRFDPEGKFLAVGTPVSSYLWKLSSEFPVRLQPELDGTPSACVFSSDGMLVAIAAGDHVTIYTCDDGKIRGQLIGHSDEIRALAFSPDGQLLATSADDRTVRLWHVRTAQEMMSLEGHKHPVVGVCFTNDGKTLLSLGFDNTDEAPDGPVVLRWNTN